MAEGSSKPRKGDDKTKALVIDGRVFEVTEDSLTGAALLALAGKLPADTDLLRLDGNDEAGVDEDETVDLAEGSKFKTRPAKQVTVILNGNPVQIARGNYTTETLIAALQVVPTGHVLAVVRKEAGATVLDELEPGEPVRVKKGMKFVSHVPYGGAA